MDYTNKVVFVTGGANGIGQALVRSYAKEGAVVAFCDIDTIKGGELASLTGSHFYYCNVLEEGALENVLNRIVLQLHGLDIVINNVGVSKFTPIWDIEVSEFEQIIDINLRSAFITSKFLAVYRKKNNECHKYGRIVNIASTRYLQSEEGSEAYAASKGGVVSLTHALAISLAECNITVNSISPGWIDSAAEGNFSSADKLQHPSQRVGTVDDITKCSLYLTDECNDFINGQNIVIDGGMSKKMIYVK